MIIDAMSYCNNLSVKLRLLWLFSLLLMVFFGIYVIFLLTIILIDWIFCFRTKDDYYSICSAVLYQLGLC